MEATGYKVLAAGNGVEAAALYASYDRKIDLVASDLVMPEMSVRPLVESWRRRAETRVLSCRVTLTTT